MFVIKNKNKKSRKFMFNVDGQCIKRINKIVTMDLNLQPNPLGNFLL